MPLPKLSTFDRPMLARRAGLAATTLMLLVGAFLYGGPLFARQAAAVPEERTLALFNIHTKETLNVTFKRDGRYIPSAMSELNRFLRDWRRDAETRMDPELIDLVWELGQELGATEPIHVISGYRSRETNEALRSAGRKVARRSQHINGKAMDVYFPGVDLETLRNSALVRQAGGVGFYPRSGEHGFVHVDTGTVRHWPRLGQQQLARIFREHEEQNQHQPRDERAPVYLADNGNGQDRRIAEGRRSPQDTDFPVPADKPILLASTRPGAETHPDAALEPTQVAAAVPPPAAADASAPARETATLAAAEPPTAAVQPVTFTAVAAPADEPRRSLMFFPLAIMRNQRPDTALALVRQAAYVPPQPAQFQQIIPMRGSVSEELTDEEEALIATLVPATQPPRQLSSSQLARLAGQKIDRDGKGPLLLSQHAQPLSVSDGKDGKLDAPDTVIDLLGGEDDAAAAPADLEAIPVRLGLEDAIREPGDADGEQPLSVAEGTRR